jgi:ferrochelatase
MQFAEGFAEKGGELRYIPCLNDSDAHAEALAALAQRAARDESTSTNRQG